MTIKLLSLLLIIGLAAGQSFPSFPNKFSATFVRNESFIVPNGVLTNRQVLLDMPNNKAYINIVPAGGERSSPDLGEFWLIRSPAGAQVGTPQKDATVLFSRVRANDGMPYCQYTTTADWTSSNFAPPGKFPSHWVEGTSMKVKEWFSFTTETMQYQGSQNWGSLQVDRWDSQTNCPAFGQPLPCDRVAVKATTNIPVATQTAYAKKPGTFESDWITLDSWYNFQGDSTRVPDVTLPATDWITKCYNHENGFTISPERAFVSTATESDVMEIRLHPNGPPISSLGAVKLNFIVSGNTEFVTFVLDDGSDANGYEITAAKALDPVRVHLKYQSAGETSFNVVATGGGYDIPHVVTAQQVSPSVDTRSARMRAITCATGRVGYGCS